MDIGKVLNLKFSDKIITRVAFYAGAGIIILFIININSLTGISPYIFFTFVYLWLKSTLVDRARIRKGEKITMPGFVFWVYGIQFFVLWAIDDMMYSPLIFGPSPARRFLYFQYPFFFWGILELATSSALFFLKWAERMPKKKIEWVLTMDALRYMVLFFIFVFLDLVIG